MKTKVLTILMIALSLSAMAQTKKVAILETVDRDNKLSYGVRLMVRSNLAEAVATTQGYEAYDRTNLNAILDEQTFQRTGYVSDDQIREIGKMTGVKYILVAEASKVDEGHVFITAKILDVVTARTENISSQLLGISPEQIQKGCQTLAGKLLTVEPEVVEVPQEIEVSGEPIIRVRRNEYQLGNIWMTTKEYHQFINDRNRCVPAYQQFQKGLALEKYGKWTTIAGATVLLAGTMTLAIGVPVNDNKAYEMIGKAEDYQNRYSTDGYKASTKYPYEGTEYDGYSTRYWTSYSTYNLARSAYIENSHYRNVTVNCAIAGSILTSVGGAATITGATLWSVGVGKKNGVGTKHNTLKEYNSHCAQPLTLNVQYTGNGMGLALNF